MRRVSDMLSSVQWTKSLQHTMRKFSSRQICMSLLSHALCVLALFGSWESEMSSLGVPMNDLAVVGLSSASTKCTPPLLSNSLFSLFLLLCSTYDREDGELAFQTFPGIFREEAIMLLRDFYMQENQNGTQHRV